MRTSRRAARRTPLALALAGLAYGWATPALAGEVEGVALLEGPPPLTAPLPVTKDHAACGQEVEDESVRVAGGRLANVAVVLKGAPPPSPVKVTLDQRRCRFVPHVLVAPVGSTLDIVNGDPVLHNVHGWAGLRSRFNEPMPAQNMRVPAKLDRAGLIQVRCDVHAWMSAYVVVADGPAALSGEDGTFTLRDVPPGTYTLTAWHERLGERSAEVTVTDGAKASVRLTFAAKGR